jgi:hypothetical protein
MLLVRANLTMIDGEGQLLVIVVMTFYTNMRTCIRHSFFPAGTLKLSIPLGLAKGSSWLKSQA